MLDSRCPRCGQHGVKLKRLETGKTILWNIGSEMPHDCPKQKRYWCFKCGANGAAIPIERPCVHKQREQGLIPKEESQKINQTSLF